MSPDERVKARYLGTTEVWSPGHGRVIRHGDVVDMPAREAEERSDFEVVKEEKPAKPARGGEKE